MALIDPDYEEEIVTTGDKGIFVRIPEAGRKIILLISVKVQMELS